MLSKQLLQAILCAVLSTVYKRLFIPTSTKSTSTPAGSLYPAVIVLVSIPRNWGRLRTCTTMCTRLSLIALPLHNYGDKARHMLLECCNNYNVLLVL